MEKEAADEEGSIPYRPSQKNGYVFADGVGMAGSFLVKYGVSFRNAHSVQLGLKQMPQQVHHLYKKEAFRHRSTGQNSFLRRMRNMFLFGIDEKTGLPYHGFQCVKCAQNPSVKYGIIGWGRAVGFPFSSAASFSIRNRYSAILSAPFLYFSSLVAAYKSYHEKTGKQKIKDTVKRAAGRYVAPKDLIFWPTAMIANCLTEWKVGGGHLSQPQLHAMCIPKTYAVFYKERTCHPYASGLRR